MANDDNYQAVLEELSLMLIYLTRFRETRNITPDKEAAKKNYISF